MQATDILLGAASTSKAKLYRVTLPAIMLPPAPTQLTFFGILNATLTVEICTVQNWPRRKHHSSRELTNGNEQVPFPAPIERISCTWSNTQLLRIGGR